MWLRVEGALCDGGNGRGVGGTAAEELLVEDRGTGLDGLLLPPLLPVCPVTISNSILRTLTLTPLVLNPLLMLSVSIDGLGGPLLPPIEPARLLSVLARKFGNDSLRFGEIPAGFVIGGGEGPTDFGFEGPAPGGKLPVTGEPFRFEEAKGGKGKFDREAGDGDGDSPLNEVMGGGGDKVRLL